MKITDAVSWLAAMTAGMEIFPVSPYKVARRPYGKSKLLHVVFADR
jgi:hypothetical protein